VVKPAVFPQVDAIRVPRSREATPPRAGRSEESTSFGKVLDRALHKVDGDLKQADQAVKDFLQGRLDIQQMAISLERADLTLRLLTRVRNRVIDAYREISRMNI